MIKITNFGTSYLKLNSSTQTFLMIESRVILNKISNIIRIIQRILMISV